jgi:hypothetical protein
VDVHSTQSNIIEHYHTLVDCKTHEKKRFVVKKLSGYNDQVVFDNLGISKVLQNSFKEEVSERMKIRRKELGHKLTTWDQQKIKDTASQNVKDTCSSRLKLMFEAFLYDSQLGSNCLVKVAEDKFSEEITDLSNSTTGDLIIRKISTAHDCASGGAEVMIFTGGGKMEAKISHARAIFEVKFFELGTNESNEEPKIWSQTVKISEDHLHTVGQFLGGLHFQVPPYRDKAITQPTQNVRFQLIKRNKSKYEQIQGRSDALTFTYTPLAGFMTRKRPQEDLKAEEILTKYKKFYQQLPTAVPFNTQFKRRAADEVDVNVVLSDIPATVQDQYLSLPPLPQSQQLSGSGSHFPNQSILSLSQPKQVFLETQNQTLSSMSSEYFVNQTSFQQAQTSPLYCTDPASQSMLSIVPQMTHSGPVEERLDTSQQSLFQISSSLQGQFETSPNYTPASPFSPSQISGLAINSPNPEPPVSISNHLSPYQLMSPLSHINSTNTILPNTMRTDHHSLPSPVDTSNVISTVSTTPEGNPFTLDLPSEQLSTLDFNFDLKDMIFVDNATNNKSGDREVNRSPGPGNRIENIIDVIATDSNAQDCMNKVENIVAPKTQFEKKIDNVDTAKQNTTESNIDNCGKTRKFDNFKMDSPVEKQDESISMLKESNPIKQHNYKKFCERENEKEEKTEDLTVRIKTLQL